MTMCRLPLGLLAASLLATLACETGSPGGPGVSETQGSTPASTINGTASTTPSPRHLEMDPIHASFSQATFTTSYDLDADYPQGPVTVTWTLQLMLIDPAGAQDPTVPGSKAEVDLQCTNNSVGLPNSPYIERSSVDFESVFKWTHPDPGNSSPPGAYNCDHTKMGPHGHQGLVAVVVTDGIWRCTNSYKGTNPGFSTDQGQPGSPKCSKI
jgi:hypothetical protein